MLYKLNRYYKAAKESELYSQRNEEIFKRAEKGQVTREQMNMITCILFTMIELYLTTYIDQTLNRKTNLEQSTEDYKRAVVRIL